MVSVYGYSHERRANTTVWLEMKKYFFTGMVVLLPLTITIVVVAFLINVLTDPFMDAVRGTLEGLGLQNWHLGFLKADTILLIISRVLILLFLFIATMIIGTLTRWFVIHTFINVFESILSRIPVVNMIYNLCKDVIQTILNSERSFKQVVLVPFPSQEMYTIGLVTREGISTPTSEAPLTAVFIPTTPNPTSGYLTMYRAEELIFLDMSIENALKYVISCGVLTSPFNQTAEESTAGGPLGEALSSALSNSSQTEEATHS